MAYFFLGPPRRCHVWLSLSLCITLLCLVSFGSLCWLMPGTHHSKPWAPPISLFMGKRPISTWSHGLFLSYWLLLFWPLQRWGYSCLIFCTVSISIFTVITLNIWNFEIIHRWMEIQLAAFALSAIRTINTGQGLFWLLLVWSLSLAAISWYEVWEIYFHSVWQLDMRHKEIYLDVFIYVDWYHNLIFQGLWHCFPLRVTTRGYSVKKLLVKSMKPCWGLVSLGFLLKFFAHHTACNAFIKNKMKSTPNYDNTNFSNRGR